MNAKRFNPKIGNQLGGLILTHSVHHAAMLRLEPNIRQKVREGMLELANIELSAQYVHPEITERRLMQFLEWEIVTLGTADFVERMLDEAVKLN